MFTLTFQFSEMPMPQVKVTHGALELVVIMIYKCETFSDKRKQPPPKPLCPEELANFNTDWVNKKKIKA